MVVMEVVVVGGGDRRCLLGGSGGGGGDGRTLKFDCQQSVVRSLSINCEQRSYSTRWDGLFFVFADRRVVRRTEPSYARRPLNARSDIVRRQ